ncbi:MAG: sulfatase-like hydrolase/transferase [Verrucomicrobia bacterium]|nr:sulfatase-like hydrolase/transferase [Verrucomicrobiota bacterium]
MPNFLFICTDDHRWDAMGVVQREQGERARFPMVYKELGDVPTCFAIRTTTHKLIKYPNLPEFTEVFDLTADPYEIKNLVSDTALTSKLDADLGQLMKTVNYTVPSNANQARLPVPTKPNVIIILADDLGYGDVQCYNRERGKIATPHLDRLASQGMRFTDAHTSSGVCSPTRYSLLTGRYHWRSRLQQGIVDYLGSPLIPPGRLTLAGLLKQHGYRTGIIGKWHLGWNMQLTDEERKLLKSYGGKPVGGRQVIGVATDEDRTAWRTIYSRQLRGGPVTLGFDSYFGTDVPNWPPYCFIENDRTMGIPSELLAADALRKNQASFQGPALADWKLENVLPTLGDRACAFIEDAAKKPEPFLLYLPLTAPHTPIAVAEQWRGKSGLNDYADFVMQTDATVARVLVSLEKSGAADKTLVIFTSDNGCAPYAGVKDLEAKGHFPSGPLRGYKADAWEGGHRVPFIVRWPGIVKPATRCDALVQQTDIMATLAETLGAKLPANVGEDSVSLMPLLKGSDKPTREYAVSHASSGLPALRKGSWKIIFGQMGGGFGGAPGVAESGQLYDLAADLGETKNIWLDKPELVAELTTTMTRLVTEGRSTPGAKQQNDVPVRWQRFLPSSSPAQ